MLQCTRVRDFDDRFTAKQFGYPSWKEYYADMNLRGKVNKIQTPLLAVNAHDDPFSPGECEYIYYKGYVSGVSGLLV